MHPPLQLTATRPVMGSNTGHAFSILWCCCLLSESGEIQIFLSKLWGKYIFLRTYYSCDSVSVCTLLSSQVWINTSTTSLFHVVMESSAYCCPHPLNHVYSCVNKASCYFRNLRPFNKHFRVKSSKTWGRRWQPRAAWLFMHKCWWKQLNKNARAWYCFHRSHCKAINHFTVTKFTSRYKLIST